MFNFVNVKIKLPRCDWIDYGTVLKIETKQQALDYFRSNNHAIHALQNFRKNIDHLHFSNYLTRATVVSSRVKNISFIDSLADILSSQLKTMFSIIDNGNICYINYNGGITPYDKNYERQEEFVENNEKLVWPQFNESNIHITQWFDGSHYYANVGNTRVWELNNDTHTEKWNTHSEAFEAAKRFINRKLKQ